MEGTVMILDVPATNLAQWLAAHTQDVSRYSYTDEGVQMSFKPIPRPIREVYGETELSIYAVTEVIETIVVKEEGKEEGRRVLLRDSHRSSEPCISFWLIPLGTRTELTTWCKCDEGRCFDAGNRWCECDREIKSYYTRLLQKLRELGGEAPRAELDAGPARRSGGPALAIKELIYRLAKAQQAEEIKQANPRMTWKEIAASIEWKLGAGKPGIKLLEDARHRLHRLEEDDPDGLLTQVLGWRERERRKE